MTSGSKQKKFFNSRPVFHNRQFLCGGGCPGNISLILDFVIFFPSVSASPPPSPSLLPPPPCFFFLFWFNFLLVSLRSFQGYICRTDHSFYKTISTICLFFRSNSVPFVRSLVDLNTQTLIYFASIYRCKLRRWPLLSPARSASISRT